MNATETPVDLPEDLSELTVAQLRALADDAKIDVPKSAPKAVLVEAIDEYRADVRSTVAAIDAGIADAMRRGEPEEVEGEAIEETDEPIDDETAEMESTALALREEPPASVPALLPTTAEFDAMLAIAGRIASTQMVPLAYRGKPDDVLAAILTGREMGLGPMQSLRDIYVVDGKPSLSANLLMARMRSGGIVVEASSSDARRAWIRARRRDTGEVAEVDWTIEEAETATYRVKGGATKPLVSKDNWTNYPADMLWARAVGRLARRLGGDLIGAAMPYTSEEVQDWEEPEAETGHGADRLAGQWIAPKDWKELAARISEQLGGDAAAWMEELAEKAYKQPSFADVVKSLDDPGKRDLWRRMGVVLRGLEDAERPVDGPLTFVVGVRQVIQRIVYDAFDQTIALTGPSWALDPEEAKTLPQRDGTPPPEAPGADLPSGTAAATDPSTETPQAASGAEASPGTAPEPGGGAPGDDIDAIKF